MKNICTGKARTLCAAENKQRDSNLELYRIIVMLLIVAHHYVVNSGLIGEGSPIYNDPMSGASLFLLAFGAFGKTGINCFVLISGYFMCQSRITAKKFAKLLGEVVFYDILINVIFWATGYEPFTLTSFLKNILPFTTLTQNFTGCYLVFFLFIPFLNILIQHLSRQQHLCLIALCSFTYILMGTVPFFSVAMNYVSWFIVLYFIASYIRLYPEKIFERTGLWGGLSLLFIVLSLLSVLVCTWLGNKLGRFLSYTFVSDSNTLLAVATGLATFLFFKNIKLKQNRFINMVSGTTFGVLLIHAAGDSMRKWLWKDVLQVTDMYGNKFMPLHAIGSVIGVFIFCSAIDLLRINLIEKPLLGLWDDYYDCVKSRFVRLGEKLWAKKSEPAQETQQDK